MSKREDMGRMAFLKLFWMDRKIDPPPEDSDRLLEFFLEEAAR